MFINYKNHGSIEVTLLSVGALKDKSLNNPFNKFWWLPEEVFDGWRLHGKQKIKAKQTKSNETQPKKELTLVRFMVQLKDMSTSTSLISKEIALLGRGGVTGVHIIENVLLICVHIVYTNIKPGIRYAWTDAKISLNCSDLKCRQCVCV